MIQGVEQITPFALVAYTMWATPGPNNMMLAYSGARFGIRRTVPHIAGILAGTLLLNAAGILGLQPIIESWPQAMWLLKIIGTIWLVKIGWNMAHASHHPQKVEQSQPMRFHAALLFQFVNPKAISATLALASLVLTALQSNMALLPLVVLACPLLGLLAITPWALAGHGISRFLSTPARWKLFTWTTGGLTAGCALFLWL